MKKPALDPADLALERARQLKAVQLSRGEGDPPTPASTPAEAAPEPVVVAEPEKPIAATRPEKLPPRKKPAYDKGEKRWKTSVQLSRRHEKIVNELLMHYRMQGLRPVSANTIILAALELLKRTPELDETVQAIVAADRRVSRLS
jgi:hypothetical protein